MPIDFPSSPTNGQVSGNYYYDATTGAWRSFSSTVNPIPSTLKNLTVSSSEATGVSLKVTPFTTSSVNLQEWYNTSSTVVASMNVAGDLTVNSLTLTTDLSVANGGTGASSFTSGAYLKGAGTAAITAQTGIPASDVTSGQLAPAQGGVPTGSIMMWYTNTPPTGWLLCNGQSTTGYTALAAVVGANVPNMQNRVPVGRNETSGTFFVNPGTTGGVESTSLNVNHIPQHSHAIDHDHGAFTSGGGSAHRHWISSAAYDDGNGTTTGMNQQDYGLWADAGSYSANDANKGTGRYSAYESGHTHSIDVPNFTGNSGNYGTATVTPVSALQPYIVINYIIKT